MAKYDAYECQGCKRFRPLTSCKICGMMICLHCNEIYPHAEIVYLNHLPAFESKKGKVA